MKTCNKAVSSMSIFMLIVAVILAGCSGNNDNTAAESPSQTSAVVSSAEPETEPEAEPEPAIDISKEVKLTGYLLGAAPPGMSEVVDELNRRLKADINATIEFNYIGWADFQSKYPLVLASGEDVDFIFTANWSYYAQEAAKNAFYEIKEEMVQKYMPLHYKALENTDAWEQTKVNGAGYMIPTSNLDPNVFVALIRGDLRKKYGLPEITKFSEIEPYLEAIKQNEPEMIPLNLDSQYDLNLPFNGLRYEKLAFTNVGGVQGIGYDWDDLSGSFFYELEGASLDAAKSAAATMKSWYDKAYVNKNPFANKIKSSVALCEGKSGVGFGNTIDSVSAIESCTSKGYEIEIISMLSGKGTFSAPGYLGNGVALGANGKNPERAMMALDLIMEDPAYNYLVYFGIEGKNYVITDDGKLDLPPGMTADQNSYPPDAAGFWFTNKSIFKPWKSWTTSYIDHRDQARSAMRQTAFSTFTPITDNFKTESANIAQVYTQYYNPIYIGAVKDVDAAFVTLDEKLQAAGITKVYDEMKQQIDAYLAGI